MGADPVAIYQYVYERGSLNRMRLLGKALATMQNDEWWKIAYIVLTREMLDSTNTTEVDTEAFVPYTLSIDNVQIGFDVFGVTWFCKKWASVRKEISGLMN